MKHENDKTSALPEIALQRQRQYLLLLSWEKKIQDLSKKEKPPHDTTLEMKQERFDDFQVYCQAHAAQVSQRLEDLRSKMRGAIQEEGQCLKRTLAAQKKLLAQATKGAKNPAGLNEKNRRLQDRIHQSRSAITIYNQSMAAHKPEDLGGIVDLPLLDYSARTGRPFGYRKELFDKQDRITFLLSALALCILALGAAYYLFARTQVSFESTLLMPGEEELRLNINNQSAYPITLFVPQNDSLALEQTKHAYSVRLWIQEQAGPLPPFPRANDLWSHNGFPTWLRDPIVLEPGIAADFVFSPSPYGPAREKLHAIRIEAIRMGGATVYEAEYVLKRKD